MASVSGTTDGFSERFLPDEHCSGILLLGFIKTPGKAFFRKGISANSLKKVMCGS